MSHYGHDREERPRPRHSFIPEMKTMTQCLPRLRRPVGAGLGVLLDRLLGEPPAPVHPVVLFGRAMGATEQRLYRDTRLAGAVHAAVGTALGAGAGALTRSTTVATTIAAFRPGLACRVCRHHPPNCGAVARCATAVVYQRSRRTSRRRKTPGRVP